MMDAFIHLASELRLTCAACGFTKIFGLSLPVARPIVDPHGILAHGAQLTGEQHGKHGKTGLRYLNSGPAFFHACVGEPPDISQIDCDFP